MDEGWSIEAQVDLFTRLGYEISNWNPDNSVEVNKLATIALNALLTGKDASGNPLSENDLCMLRTITGRG